MDARSKLNSGIIHEIFVRFTCIFLDGEAGDFIIGASVLFGVTKINDKEIVIRSAKSHTVTLTPLLVQPNS